LFFGALPEDGENFGEALYGTQKVRRREKQRSDRPLREGGGGGSARVRRLYSLKAKLSENESFFLLSSEKSVFSLFACKRNTSKSENKESETKELSEKLRFQ
jgi:hypothetical protein